MTDLIVVPQAAQWQRLKRLVLDSVSSPITRRVYNLGLDEFFAWFGEAPRPGFTKATVCAWRVALEARGLGAVSINVRITAVRKLAVEAADNGLLAPELAAGITRVKVVASKGVRLGNWLSIRQAQTLLNTPDASTTKGLRDRAILAVLLGCGLRRSEVAAALADSPGAVMRGRTGGARQRRIRRMVDGFHDVPQSRHVTGARLLPKLRNNTRTGSGSCSKA
jgi:site-specific recombinase XerD